MRRTQALVAATARAFTSLTAKSNQEIIVSSRIMSSCSTFAPVRGMALRSYTAMAAKAAANQGRSAHASSRVILPSRGFSIVAEAGESEGDDAAPAPRGEENKLYIGNLSWNTTDEELSRVFSDFDVQEASVVIDRMNGRSRGFAFVTVGSAEAMQGAIDALDGADVDGREIRVSQAQTQPRDRADRPPRMERDGGRDGGRGRGRGMVNDKRRVYFGNLSWGMDHLDLQDLCAEFGNVEDSRLITDRETGRSRGFGFVTMSSESEADEVVNQLNGQDVDGRVLRVNIANSD